MSQVNDILQMIDRMTPAKREELEAKLAERRASGQKRIVADVRDAHAEFKRGGAKRASFDEIVGEIES